MNIKIGLVINVLDLVDPWLEFPVFEDGGVISRVHGHGRQNKCGGVENASRLQCYYRRLSIPQTCARHTFAVREGAGVHRSAHHNHYSEKVSVQGRN